MATPDFILSLRERIGHELLWLPGVTGVVLDSLEAPTRVLLVERQDNGRWALVTGILEPGEAPAEGLLREIEEETGVRARTEALFDVDTTGIITFPNKDQCSFLNLSFRCESLSGEARVNDDESTAVSWWPLEALPDSLTDRHARLIRGALTHTGPGAAYEVPGNQAERA
ncbi:NUDIX domain-containing protein [Falsarthrobacter nasiphocae]|uniref:ADP-ribose pyrophosphatase YjhB (NUDIX family) n=1 Tax=Falsarthrobacter nasiphocae TaxID=189863 RepID=A0AAE3YGM0_9MICC|nr:NUDIX domain-containing protein [Falsarthrobacter nasiphocae]MDR6891641.1 ADP-ribose pyrophosphatase YjhB (NUDIX family) [Falsarthrobacter nasiphocae]